MTGNTASVADGGIANASPFGAPLGSFTAHNTQVNGNSPNNRIPVGPIAGCNDSVYVFTADLSRLAGVPQMCSRRFPILGVSGWGSLSARPFMAPTPFRGRRVGVGAL